MKSFDICPAWMRSYRFFSCRIPCIFLLLVCLASCGDGQKGQAERKPAPVRLTKAEARDVPRVLEAVGTVEAFNSVDVKSQVGGQIVEVPVTPGQEVKAGDVLFRLDPRPFDAAVAEAEARLSRNRALLEKARQDLIRYSALLKQDVISRENYDQMATAEKTARASIEGDEAALEAAKLSRDYSVIKAPISGKLGDILVRLGNVIKANDDRTLVVIKTLRPVEVRFTVAERYLPLVLARMREGGLGVSVLPEGDTGAPMPGPVTAVDNAVDRATGSIRLLATLDNAENRLWPGQFVRVTLVTDTIKGAVTIPGKAVQEGLRGPFVYVAVRNGTYYQVQPRPITSEPAPGDAVMVTKGLAAGEVVITDGQLGLSPGSLARDLGAGE